MIKILCEELFKAIFIVIYAIRIKDKAWECLNCIVILEAFAKFGEFRLKFITKRMHSLVNEESLYNMKLIENNI